MHFVKLSKPVKTTVRSFEKDAEGKVTDKELATRDVSIPVEVPAYDSIPDAVQAAQGEDKLLAWINKHVRAEAVSPVRLIGSKFTTDNTDEEVISQGQALAKDANVFVAKAKGQGKNKELADRMRSLEAMVSSGKSAEDILAFLKQHTV